MKPCRIKDVLGSEFILLRSPGVWLLGPQAVQPWTRTVRSLIGVTFFSTEMLSRWDSCPWSLPKLHGSSTMPSAYQWPDLDLLSWFPGLISDLSHHFRFLICTVGWTWLPSSLVSEVTASTCPAATALSPSFAGQFMVGLDLPLLALGICSAGHRLCKTKSKKCIF